MLTTSPAPASRGVETPHSLSVIARRPGERRGSSQNAGRVVTPAEGPRQGRPDGEESSPGLSRPLRRLMLNPKRVGSGIVALFRRTGLVPPTSLHDQPVARAKIDLGPSSVSSWSRASAPRAKHTAVFARRQFQVATHVRDAFAAGKCICHWCSHGALPSVGVVFASVCEDGLSVFVTKVRPCLFGYTVNLSCICCSAVWIDPGQDKAVGDGGGDSHALTPLLLTGPLLTVLARRFRCLGAKPADRFRRRGHAYAGRLPTPPSQPFDPLGVCTTLNEAKGGCVTFPRVPPLFPGGPFRAVVGPSSPCLSTVLRAEVDDPFPRHSAFLRHPE
ncbi:hypothetical protein CRENBAI_005579 [Crenichthys baileyi]|uniref:Uncharacterized protein n=1 Tax=Crenichthys baileyi TaxID=28760 RepID=A0AAV9SEX6_9TELE